MLKVKASDPNRTFGTEFGVSHFFHPEGRNMYELASNVGVFASKFLRLILFEFASKSYQIRS